MALKTSVGEVVLVLVVVGGLLAYNHDRKIEEKLQADRDAECARIKAEPFICEKYMAEIAARTTVYADGSVDKPVGRYGVGDPPSCAVKARDYQARLQGCLANP